MIKIIKEGTIKKCTCDECGCYFSYEDEDVLKKSNLSFSGTTLYRELISCPQCDKEIVLKSTR